MMYVIIIVVILLGVFYFKTSSEVNKRESFTEPLNVNDIKGQLSMTMKLYIVESFTQIVGDEYGNLNRPGFAASIKLGDELGITPDIMRKYKYVNLSENSMSKSLFLLKRWQRDYVATCIAFVYQHTTPKSQKMEDIFKIKLQVLQIDSNSYVAELNNTHEKRFNNLYKSVQNYSKNTQW